MFLSGQGKPALTLTPAAVQQVRRLAERAGGGGLRIGVKKGGCAGMEYTMDFVAAPGEGDEVVEQDGVRILLAPMAQMLLIGTEIDYETDLLHAGFRFRNPNVSDSCGCGESVRFGDMPGS